MSLISLPKAAEPAAQAAASDGAGLEWPGYREWRSSTNLPEAFQHAGRLGALRAFLRKPRGVFGLVLLLALLAMAASAPWLYPGDPLDSVAQPLLWPGQDMAHPLGSDSLGRDVAAALFHGSITSLSVGFGAAGISLSIGVLIGSLAGYFGGWVGAALMRLTELLQTTPVFLFVIVLVTLLQPNTGVIVIAIGLTSWPALARLVRAEFRQLLQSDFVLAARSAGFGDARIILGEILPNVAPSIVVMASFSVATAIFLESSLAFLGLGDPNLASWGGMINEGRDFIRTDWCLTVIPGLAIMAAVFSLNLIGDALTDALNPRLRSVE